MPAMPTFEPSGIGTHCTHRTFLLCSAGFAHKNDGLAKARGSVRVQLNRFLPRVWGRWRAQRVGGGTRRSFRATHNRLALRRLSSRPFHHASHGPPPPPAGEEPRRTGLSAAFVFYVKPASGERGDIGRPGEQAAHHLLFFGRYQKVYVLIKGPITDGYQMVDHLIKATVSAGATWSL